MVMIETKALVTFFNTGLYSQQVRGIAFDASDLSHIYAFRQSSPVSQARYRVSHRVPPNAMKTGTLAPMNVS
ncbi:hypothetical protein DICSQDRAFT_148954 [Dichomitus squalens LYAD-421 SS1]|uniref:Uncharacterized protein n=1 Tax=Dichomitus squalens (strain LYAD-421) TaxID=732165 RepID=R7SS44_DICSQ|nr:uncharacterized protein DICSQDRAFT_148954 [Dichomitus squalens LYAD-421 SS1]EJF58758.1 hypothetical protein DICSQDRAFT_148954 [Dichomitus squalens LYAD-421 SS1]